MTGLGINNSGELKMPYGKEDIDFAVDGDPSSGYIFNGAQSVIFRRIRLLMHNDLAAMYQNRESVGAWTSTTFIQEADNLQAEWPEELWRLDIQRKYERPYLGTSIDNSIPKTSDRFLKTMMNGRKKYHRRQFERDQSVYMDTKYLASAIRDDQIMFRCNTPQSAVVAPNYTLRIVPYSDMYLSVMFGNTTPIQIRAKAGKSYSMECPLSTMDDTAILIYAASRIQALNDLSACYIHDNDFSKAAKLQTLIIGNTTPGYANSFLTSLTIGGNTLLKTLDLRNCPNLTGSLNLSRCNSLLTLRAEGTALTGVVFSTKGKVNTAYLPDTVTSLTMRDLDYLTSVHNNLDNLETLILENGVMDSLALMQNVYDTVQSVRLIGVDWTIPSSSLLNSIYAMNSSFISGSVYINGPVRIRELNQYAAKWEDLEVTYNPNYLVDQYVATYVNTNGVTLYTAYVDRGSVPPDPVALGYINAPTQVSSAQYDYTFSGWDEITSVMLASRTIVATYSESVRTYTITWYSRSGVPITSTRAPYGAEVVYDGDTPTRTDEESNYIYNVFTGWDKSTGFIKGDTDVYAVWDRKSLPSPGKNLNNMSVAEIYGLANAPSVTISDYLSAKDYIDINVGNDFSFSNVESAVLCQDVWLDGNTYLDTGIQLFSPTAPSFTLAIDFEYYDTTANSTLVSCYEENGNEGFRLRYSSGNPTIQWGDKTATAGYGTSRGLVVLRHIKGADKLYVYTFNTGGGSYNDAMSQFEITRSRSTNTVTTLVFGAVKFLEDGGFDYFAKGWIHWCKIWYEDLGDANAQELAAWPHETWRAEFAAGTNRYRIPGTSKYAKISFILNNLLELPHVISYSYMNSGGWPATLMRTFVNSRIYAALPIGWRSILRRVRVNSSAGNRSNEIVYSDDLIYIPSVTEINNNQNDPYASEGKFIPWYITDSSRIKFKGQIIPENSTIYTTNDEPTSISTNNVVAGDRWIYQSGCYLYIPESIASKHRYSESSGSNIQANDGGLWLHSSEWWTRSPHAEYSEYYIYVTYSGYSYFPTIPNTEYGVDICFSV